MAEGAVVVVVVVVVVAEEAVVLRWWVSVIRQQSTSPHLCKNFQQSLDIAISPSCLCSQHDAEGEQIYNIIIPVVRLRWVREGRWLNFQRLVLDCAAGIKRLMPNLCSWARINQNQTTDRSNGSRLIESQQWRKYHSLQKIKFLFVLSSIQLRF